MKHCDKKVVLITAFTFITSDLIYDDLCE